MEILRSISLYADSKSLYFVLIGGHAVNAYGISRQTGDIDLIIKRSQSTEWNLLFEKIRYTKGQNDERFIRFKPDTIAAWPIDLMLVDDQTFDKIFSQAVDMDLGSVHVKVASARHLATLKLHALKHYQAHRYVKDYSDLLQLLSTKCSNLRGTELKELCLKYANQEIYDKLIIDLKERL